MAASQTLTESALNNIQARIGTMFLGDTPTLYPYNEPAFTAGALMERNRANINPLLTSTGLCIGIDVSWLVAGATSIVAQEGGGGYDLDCDITPGQYPESDTRTYETEPLALAVVSVNDNLCGDLFNDAPGAINGREKAATLIQERLLKAMKDLRGELNNYAVDFLETNRTHVNSDGSLPSYLSWDGTNFWYEAAESLFQTPDFLTDLDATAANSNMQSYFMLSGRSNFYNSVANAQYRVLNDNERFLARYANYDMAFDIRALDSRLGEKTTFVVGEGTYAFWNNSVSPSEQSPFQVDYDKWRFVIEDPVLRIYENGRLRPVQYEVLYQKVCSARDTLTHPVFNHHFEIKFLGGLEAAPVNSASNTGILKFVAQPEGV